jgi:cobalt-zinc-cadmium efflux system outer membrane protein
MYSDKLSRPNWPVRGLAAIACSALLTSAALSQPAPQDTSLELSTVLQRAVQSHPRLSAVQAELAARRSEARQAGLWDNPSLQAEIEDFGGDRGDIGDGDLTVAVRQTIPLGGDRRRAREAAEAWARVETARLNAEIAGLLGDAATAFVDARAAQETARVRAELQDLAETAASAIRQRVEAGRSSPIDLDRADILVGTAGMNAVSASTEARRASLALAAIWGGALAGDVAPPSGLMNNPDLSALTADAMMRSNPDLALARQTSRARGEEIARERATAVPDLTVGAGIRRYGSDNETAYLAMVEMPIPVIDRNQGAIAAAVARETGARLDEEALRRQLLARHAAAYRRWSDAQQRHAALSESVLPAARNAFSRASLAYREGALQLLDLLDVQRTYFDTRIRAIEARADLARAAIELDVLLGAPRLKQLAGIAGAEVNP